MKSVPASVSVLPVPRWPAWLLLAALAAFPAARAAVPLPASLEGLWRVADSACPGCDPVQGAEAGAELRLSARGAQNPFGGDCSGPLEAEALPAEPVPAVQQRLSLPARWLAGAEAAPAQSWRLVCAGKPGDTLILLANGALLLPSEASNVLRLLRVR